jgi:hypothetical protein
MAIVSIFLVMVALIAGMVGFPADLGLAPAFQYGLPIPKIVGAEVTTMAESSENVTTYDGDLIIDGYEEFLIENCTWIQNGNIYVRGHGQLIVRNATLEVSQTYLYQYEFKVEDLATLIMENAELTSDYGLHFCFLDDSGGSIHNLKLDIGEFSTLDFYGRSRLEVDSMVFERSHGINVGEYADVSITNSIIGSMDVVAETPTIRIADSEVTWRFGLRFARDESTVNITGLTPGYKEYLDLSEKVIITRDGSYIPIGITLSEMYIQGWNIWIHYDSEATVSDSTLRHLKILVAGISCSIENLKAQFYGEMHIGQIILNRTQITEIVMVEPYDDAEVTIINSIVSLNPMSNSRVYCVDSVFDGIMAGDFIGSLGLNGTTLRGGANVVYSNFFISGDGSFKDFASIEWHESNITRNYGVILNDAHQDPVSDASLTLRSEAGTQIWNGTTDSQGRASFNLTFNDSNYTDTLRLEAVKGNMFDAQDIVLFSDTPIILIALDQYNLVISSTFGGSVTTPGEGDFTYEEGIAVDLVAEADEGYRFVGWIGDVATIADVEAASTTIMMNDDYSITATFEAVAGCFIATAAYGTSIGEEIQILREFRDEYLLTNSLGRALVDFYYTASPSIAKFITEHPSLKPIVRDGLMPVVAMCRIVLDIIPQFADSKV